MLCGVSVVFNSLGDVLGLMCCKCNSEKGQVLIGFQSTEAFGCLHHAGGGPAQRHRVNFATMETDLSLGPAPAVADAASATPTVFATQVMGPVLRPRPRFR